MGEFSFRRSEDGRTGSHHGISYSFDSEPPKKLAFDNYEDQIHHITMRVPNYLFQSTGKLTVEFRALLSHAIHGESAGFDNIKVTANFDCDGKPIDVCPPSTPTHFEDFQDGRSTGWVNGKVENSRGFSLFLGRYSLDDGDRLPYKTFSVATDADEMLLELDFLEIDTWDANDGDSLEIRIDNNPISLGVFDYKVDESGRSGSAYGISWHMKSLHAPKDIGGNIYNDQIHHVTLRIPNTYFRSDGQLKVDLRPSVDKGVDNESAGFDNIKLTPIYNCNRR